MQDERPVGVTYSSTDSFVSSFDEAAATLAVRSAGGLQPSEPVSLDVRVPGRERVVVHGVVGTPRTDGPRGMRVKVDAAGLRRLRKAIRGEERLNGRPVRFDIGDLPLRCHRDGKVFLSTIRDVSDGGCYLTTRGEAPAPGTHLTLEFNAPGGNGRARVEAAVTWVERGEGRNGFGVRFGPGQEEAVRRFVFRVLLAD